MHNLSEWVMDFLSKEKIKVLTKIIKTTMAVDGDLRSHFSQLEVSISKQGATHKTWQKSLVASRQDCFEENHFFVFFFVKCFYHLDLAVAKLKFY